MGILEGVRWGATKYVFVVGFTWGRFVFVRCVTAIFRRRVRVEEGLTLRGVQGVPVTYLV